jgi:carbonic anhydrase
MKLLLLVLVSLSAIFFSCNDRSSKENPGSGQKESTATAPGKPESERPVHWSYVHEGGAAGWAELSPAYAACGSGKSQSPISLPASSSTGSANFKIEYKTTGLRISHNEHMEELINNGHTIQVTPQHGSLVTYEGKRYHLKQFHFHTPSEHLVDGKNFPMEIHFVHEADDKNLLVIGVLVKEGKQNNNFDTLVRHLPNNVGEKLTHEHIKLDLVRHIPTDIKAYHYIGSLTTPPCTENVQWMVLRNFMEMSKEQVNAFFSRIGNNNRPVQPLHGREIKADHIKMSN